MVAFPSCCLPHLDAGEWVKTHARHLCRGCGEKWERAPKTAGNPLATVLTPPLVKRALLEAQAANGMDGLAAAVTASSGLADESADTPMEGVAADAPVEAA